MNEQTANTVLEAMTNNSWFGESSIKHHYFLYSLESFMSIAKIILNILFIFFLFG